MKKLNVSRANIIVILLLMSVKQIFNVFLLKINKTFRENITDK